MKRIAARSPASAASNKKQLLKKMGETDHSSCKERSTARELPRHQLEESPNDRTLD